MAQLSNNLAQYIVRVRRYLQEPTASKSHWDDNFVKQVFNTSYRKRCVDLIRAHEGYFTIIGTRDLVADQDRYAWPSGFMRLLKLEIVRSDDSRIPLQREERHYGAFRPSSTGGATQDTYLPTFRPVGSGFVLEPPPATDVTNGLYMEWLGVPEELTADDDPLHSDFPTILDELLVLDTAITLFDAEGMQESGLMRTLLRNRAEWEETWLQFINSRMIHSQRITPFRGHYNDALVTTGFC